MKSSVVILIISQHVNSNYEVRLYFEKQKLFTHYLTFNSLFGISFSGFFVD